VETTSAAHRLNRWVLVQGPAWGDAEFLSKWLLAAAQAESFWRQAYDILDFAKQVEPVCISPVMYVPPCRSIGSFQNQQPFLHVLHSHFNGSVRFLSTIHSPTPPKRS
jgi:hypothetical protein